MQTCKLFKDYFIKNYSFFIQMQGDFLKTDLKALIASIYFLVP